jgi:hypothetical protein
MSSTLTKLVNLINDEQGAAAEFAAIAIARQGRPVNSGRPEQQEKAIMELLITIPDTFPGDLAGLADATQHNGIMQRARLEWLVPQGNGRSLIRSIRITAARQVLALPGEFSPQGRIP